ncbi:30S ribosomal protein S17 [Halococcus sp. IIIV-5B]|uniref:30S ribosomal protein S17 n=1 Tax=Halococcus sp. IIIV-5B TaxID=2321230 RepID=UPI000E70C87E|nr:30S ribosomal protein S17 [Halococcus sp. IIIV-5B]
MALGLNVDEPEATCDDPNCPFHGTLSVRGGTVDGVVVSTDMDRSAVVEREYDVAVPKYDRAMKRRSRTPAHAPECLEIEVGEPVRIAETRPLSKTKSHVVVGRIDTDRDLGATSLSGPSDAESEAAMSDIEESVAEAEDGGEA